MIIDEKSLRERIALKMEVFMYSLSPVPAVQVASGYVVHH
jgi:hypothetical protein